MIGLSFSPRVSNFIDAADVSGNIRNSMLNLKYLRQIDVACVKAGIVNGVVYPVIGGVADSHKYNFLDPRDLDTAFRLTYGGTPVHNSLGIAGDGVNLIDTHYIPFNNLTNRNAHLFGYFTPNGGTNNFIVASAMSGVFFLNTNGIAAMGNPTTTDGYFTSTTNANLKSLLISDKDGDLYVMANGRYDMSAIRNEGNQYPTNSTTLGGLNGSGQRATRSIGFVSIGPGLSRATSNQFSHDIFVAQRILGRA